MPTGIRDGLRSSAAFAARDLIGTFELYSLSGSGHVHCIPGEENPLEGVETVPRVSSCLYTDLNHSVKIKNYGKFECPLNMLSFLPDKHEPFLIFNTLPYYIYIFFILRVT